MGAPVWMVAVREYRPSHISVFWQTESLGEEEEEDTWSPSDGVEYCLWYWTDESSHEEHTVEAVLTRFNYINLHNLTSGQLYYFGLSANTKDPSQDYVTFQHKTGSFDNVPVFIQI